MEGEPTPNLNGAMPTKVLEVLKKRGLKASINEELVGESGVKHHFPLVIYKEKKKVVFDIVDPKKPPSISALATYVKAFDVKAEKCFIMVDDKEKAEEIQKIIRNLNVIPLELITAEDFEREIKKLVEGL